MPFRPARREPPVDLDDLKDAIPHRSPIQPQRLGPDSEIRFDCHPGMPCFNACCRHSEVTLTPYDILRLKRRLGLTAGEFVARYTVPFEMDHHGLPGLRLAVREGGACVFLGEDGCGVYEDRPVACRYYALGSLALRRKGERTVEEVYFLVREPHCQGHEAPRRLTVRQYRREQGIEPYDEANRAWQEILLKKRSSGPTVGKPSERSLQLFDMCSYDMDRFAAFIQSDGFRRLFALSDDELAALLADEEQRLAFAMRFLKQVLFGEHSIPLRPDAREARIAERRAVWQRRREAEIARRRAAEAAQGEEEGD